MAKTWQLHDAKNRFSLLVRQAIEDGPQTVTRRGRPAVVILSVQDYARLAEPRADLVDFLLAAPLRGLDLSRDPDPEREVAVE